MSKSFDAAPLIRIQTVALLLELSTAVIMPLFVHEKGTIQTIIMLIILAIAYFALSVVYIIRLPLYRKVPNYLVCIMLLLIMPQHTGMLSGIGCLLLSRAMTEAVSFDGSLLVYVHMGMLLLGFIVAASISGNFTDN